MQVRKILVAAAIAGGMGAASMGLGAGLANAEHDWWVPQPPPPGHVGQIVNVPPGHIGQVTGVPPGHWDKPWKWGR